MREHPAVTRALRFGLIPAAAPLCPLCGAAAERFFFDPARHCVGCDDCLQAVEYWEVGVMA